MNRIPFNFVIFISLFSIVYSLTLEPVQLSVTTKKEFKFDVDPSKSGAVTDTITEYFKTINFNNINDALTISKEIELAIGISNVKVHHLKWDLSVNVNLGTLKIFSISADINNYHVDFVIKYVTLEQKIPTLYETKRKCSKSGGRKYLFCGPRDEVCNDYQVERGLNADEINLVSQALMTKMTEALLLMR